MIEEITMWLTDAYGSLMVWLDLAYAPVTAWTGLSHDPLTTTLVLLFAVLTGWSMRPRLRYYRISNNAMLVVFVAIVVAYFIHHTMIGALSLAALRASIFNVDFGTILALYAITWIVIFIFNTLRRMVGTKNDKFLFK